MQVSRGVDESVDSRRSKKVSAQLAVGGKASEVIVISARAGDRADRTALRSIEALVHY